MLTFKRKKILNLFLIIFIISFFVFPFIQTAKAQSTIGWWYEYKDYIGHHINGDVPYASKNACETAWNQNKLSSWTVVYHNPPSTEICFQSATKPAITPEFCTWPLVLDTTTNTCVAMAPTCTLPQVLDATTKTCVNPSTKTTYKLLAPLPFMEGPDQTIDTLYNKDTNPCPFGKYLNILIKLFLGIAGVLAVIMIVWGGIQYMTSELASSKEEGKKSITNAILGLLLALGAWLILNTINPDLLNVCLNNLPIAEITINPLYDRGFNDQKQANGESVRCTPVTTATSPCTVEKLTTVFGAENAVAMSKICNMESGGTSIQSGTDICKPSNDAFSFGLFQVNLAANGILAGENCAGIFNKAVSAKDVIEPRYSNGYSCNVLTEKKALYATCKSTLLNPTSNLNIAKSLFTKYGKRPWIGDKKYCASAFN